MNPIAWIFQAVIGPVVDLGKTWITKKEDTKVELGRQDVSVVQSRNTLLGQIHKDPAIAFGWYAFIVPTALWYAAIVLYCLVHPWYPAWKTVLALPPNIEYIPWAVVAFLFGLSWKGRQ